MIFRRINKYIILFYCVISPHKKVAYEYYRFRHRIVVRRYVGSRYSRRSDVVECYSVSGCA